jgi:hypothetical protein
MQTAELELEAVNLRSDEAILSGAREIRTACARRP